MKKSSILWAVLMVVLCALAIRHVFTLASFPASFTPNWLTIVPALAIWAAFVALVIRKELAAAESRTRKAQVELAIACVAPAAGETA
ncbi:MAG TPA: hypothetical protein VGR73_00470 [Bryobacteraceae bacterium]|nr:hypothetical protein [Bryobacteraceae bacterium]